MVWSVEAGEQGHFGEAVTARVVVLLTDMVGSTAMWQSQSESMPFVLSRHHELVESAIISCGGWLPVDQGEGDARLGVFSGVDALTRAAHAAVAARAMLAGERWPAGLQVRVRVAIDAGDVVVHRGNVFGTVVNRCSRVRGLAHPGQILAACSNPGTAAGAGLVWTVLGAHHLRDVPDPVEVCQVDLFGDAQPFPPLLSAAKAKAPPVADGFVGRTATLGRLAASIGVGRLVTLTAPGGTGKTTVAVAAAHRAVTDFSGGVVFVDLASVVDAEDVGTAVALAVGCLDPATPPWDSILAATVSAPMLLVLDNCEQITGLAGVLGEQRRLVTQVAWLVTSRLPVGVPGETVIALEPLTTPSGPVFDEDTLIASPAGELILALARTHRPGLTVDPATAGDLAAIAVRLDGHPLAIELAAARFRFQSVASVRHALESTLDDLVDTTGTLERRQQDLTAVLDWSVNHLAPTARHVLDALSAFESPATFAAVADVAAIAESSAFAPMTELLHAGLARAVAHDANEPRFALLTPVREHIRRAWTNTTRTDLADRHAAYHFRWAEHGSRTKHNTETDVEWLAETLAARADALAALDHLETTNPDTALQCALHLNALWYEHNDPQRGAALLTRLLPRTTPAVEDFQLAARLNLYFLTARTWDAIALTQLLVDVRTRGFPAVEAMVLQLCAEAAAPTEIMGDPIDLLDQSEVLAEHVARAEAAGERPLMGLLRACNLTFGTANSRAILARWTDPALVRKISETGFDACVGPRDPMFPVWLAQTMMCMADCDDLARTRELADLVALLPFAAYVPSIPPALALLAMRESRYDDAVDIAVDVLTRSPLPSLQSAELVLIGADALIQSHRPEAALGFLDRYRALAISQRLGPESRRARTLFELGRLAETETELDICAPSISTEEASPSVLTYHLTRALLHDGERRQSHIRAYDNLLTATGVVPWPRDAADRLHLA